MSTFRCSKMEMHPGIKADLRLEALKEAYKRMYYEIYRHKMRYEPEEHAQELNLTEGEIEDFKKFEEQETEATQDCRYVVVGLPLQDYTNNPEWYMERARKCSHKCYIGKCWYTLETGEEGDHPHLNFFFYKTVKWLARSRVVREFANSFKVDHNFVQVRSMGEHAEPEVLKYITKEDGTTLFSNMGDKPKKSKNTKKKFLEPQ